MREPVKIAFVVDARSPIAQNWIRYFVSRGDSVHVLSTAPASKFDEGIATFRVIPVALGALVASVRKDQPTELRTKPFASARRALSTHLSQFRSRLAAYDVARHAGAYREAIQAIKPDVVHAMRLPFEGIVAAEALKGTATPLVISVWGNDFTLHAARSRKVARMTRAAVERADILHPDCYRDLRLAKDFGWPRDRPAFVLPGNGGVQRDIFFGNESNAERDTTRAELGIPVNADVAFNPRGIRPYVPTGAFFQAVAQVVEARPNVVFLAAAMRDEPVAERWVTRLGIGENVRLLPKMSRFSLARYYRASDVLVSSSTHDGTPNSLIEGMACGCFPVVGNVESVCEWITHGHNGFVCNGRDPHSIARYVLKAFDSRTLREQAAIVNEGLVSERADFQKVMDDASQMYNLAARRDREITSAESPAAFAYAS